MKRRDRKNARPIGFHGKNNVYILLVSVNRSISIISIQNCILMCTSGKIKVVVFVVVVFVTLENNTCFSMVKISRIVFSKSRVKQFFLKQKRSSKRYAP